MKKKRQSFLGLGYKNCPLSDTPEEASHHAWGDHDTGTERGLSPQRLPKPQSRSAGGLGARNHQGSLEEDPAPVPFQGDYSPS